MYNSPDIEVIEISCNMQVLAFSQGDKIITPSSEDGLLNIEEYE